MMENILKSFQVWTNAQGVKSKGKVKGIDNISLEGINSLRELILDLAIRGKLVPQDPNEEPASELLKKITVEKEKLVKEGKIKKKKKLPSFPASEATEFPANWALCPLGNLTTQITDGTHHTPNYVNKGVKFLSVRDISSGKIDFSNTKFITEEEHKKLIERCKPEKNDILFCRIGTLGIPVVVETDEPFSIFVSIGLLKFLPKHVSPYYLQKVLASPYLWSQFMTIKAGGSHTNKLNLRDIPTLKIPLPPVEEQKRISAKVDELMALCDQLEQERTTNLKTHQVLVKTILDTLVQAQNAEELQKAWGRVATHFETLFCTEDSIEQLKQTILQLGIMGKLVKQDPNDEPVSVLFKRIIDERKKEGLKSFPLKNISNIEIPFNLPRGWQFVRLHQIIRISSGDSLTSSKMVKNGNVPVFGGNGITGYHNKANTSKPTLVIGRVGYYCGSVHITPKNSWVTDNAFKTFFSEKNIDIHFLAWLLKGTDLKVNQSATAQPVISGKKIYPIIVPLPPLCEQKRIVVKIEELMGLCSILTERLVELQNLQNLLAKTLVEKVAS